MHWFFSVPLAFFSLAISSTKHSVFAVSMLAADLAVGFLLHRYYSDIVSRSRR